MHPCKAYIFLAIGSLLTSHTMAAQLLKANANRIPDQYIVVFKNQANIETLSMAAKTEIANTKIQNIKKRIGAISKSEYKHVFQGFSANLNNKQLADLLNDADVAYIEEDSIVMPSDIQSPPPSWGLDRIDLPGSLDSRYEYNSNGTGVHAYIIDSGINLSHSEFTGRISNGASFVGGDNSDCRGHGTHVAGTIGGRSFGVAKGVTLHPVKVFGCTGGSPNSTIIAGIDWVRANRQLPAVANMSLGGPASQALDDATRNLINSGVSVVVAAGNEYGASACNYSPARTLEAITVGATTISNNRASFSNAGTCVDIYAPGQDIPSAWIGGTNSTMTISGTSMASPHVAGVVARYLEKSPNSTPATVAQYLKTYAENITLDTGPVKFLTYVEKFACLSSTWSTEKGSFWLVSSGLVRTYADNLQATASTSSSLVGNRIVSMQIQINGKGGSGIGGTSCNQSDFAFKASWKPADYKMVACDAYGNCRTSSTVGVYQ